MVVAALPDQYLEPAVAELSTRYEAQQFVAVPVSFAPGADYLDKIKAATDDKNVQIVFNNAGFIARTLGACPTLFEEGARTQAARSFESGEIRFLLF